MKGMIMKIYVVEARIVQGGEETDAWTEGFYISKVKAETRAAELKARHSNAYHYEVSEVEVIE